MSNKIKKKEKTIKFDDFESLIKQLNEINNAHNIKDNINQIKILIEKIFKIIINIDIKQYPYFFESFKSILENIYDFIAEHKKELTLSILEEIYFLLSNLKNKDILNFLYGKKFMINKGGTQMNILDILIYIDYKEEEILNTQVTLMKSIILKIDNETIDYFYDSNINQFAILNKSLKLYDYSESMVRATIKNILLLITKLKKNSLICYLTSFPVALYYPIIIYKFKDTISQLSNTNFNKNENIYEYLEEKHGELFYTILYLNDILFCNITNINFVIINCLLNEIIFPLLNIIISKKKEKISLANSLYILSLFIFYLKNEFIIDLICSFLFKEKIRKYLLDKIKQYNYKDNNINFMKDLNFLIKNSNNADINDIEWKRNADFIKRDIGLDLYTGVIEKDNNYHLFKHFLYNEENNNNEEAKNDIFEKIKEILTSKDDNIILNLSLLLNNVIRYYFNYFKNKKDYKDKENNSDNSENSEILGMNKIRNSEIAKNNLKILNKNNINNKTQIKKNIDFNIFNDKAAFNPFLLTFFNISEQAINNSPTLFEFLLILLKNEKNFRIITNEMILNSLIFLIQIFLTKKNYSLTEIDILNSKIKFVLKDEINKIKLLIEHSKKIAFYYYTTDSYSYYKSESFETKLTDLMKLYYILIPYNYMEQNDKIPFCLKEDKTKDKIFRNHMINIFLLLDIIQNINLKISNRNNNINNKNIINPYELEKDNEYNIGNIYKKEELGNEYAFCYIGKKLEDFQNNVDNLKKCVFIITKYNFYLGEIINKTFKDLSKIKIFLKIPLIFLDIQFLKGKNDSFLEINNINNINNEDKNKTKFIMNCFDSENTKKVNNYLMKMINNSIILEKSIFDTFLENIESKYT